MRECDERPWYADGADLAELARRETELIGSGRVAVIAPPARIAGAAAALGLAPGPDLGAPVAVLTPGQAKGLESDSAIIADPAGIEQASPRGRAAPPGAEFPGRPGRRHLAFGESGLSFRTDGGFSRYDLASRPFA